MKTQETSKPQTSAKRIYVRPQVIKHGNVETLTQGVVDCVSGPIRWDN